MLSNPKPICDSRYYARPKWVMRNSSVFHRFHHPTSWPVSLCLSISSGCCLATSMIHVSISSEKRYFTSSLKPTKHRSYPPSCSRLGWTGDYVATLLHMKPVIRLATTIFLSNITKKRRIIRTSSKLWRLRIQLAPVFFCSSDMHISIHKL